MVYKLSLNEAQMANLLEVVKGDCEGSYADGNAKNMAEDIDLLNAIARSFMNEDAKMMLEAIISGYEKDLKEIS